MGSKNNGLDSTSNWGRKLVRLIFKRPLILKILMLCLKLLAKYYDDDNFLGKYLSLFEDKLSD